MNEEQIRQQWPGTTDELIRHIHDTISTSGETWLDICRRAKDALPGTFGVDVDGALRVLEVRGVVATNETDSQKRISAACVWRRA